MSVVPKKQLENLAWNENHVAPWTTNAVAIGTTAAEVTAFEAKVVAARSALTAADEARDAAKNATLVLKNAMLAMNIAAQGIIKQVRAKAETTGNPDLYALASLPEPALPGPVAVPGTPFEFVAEIKQDGALDLAWKCKNPKGCTHVVYQVWRRVGGTGPFTYVGGSGQKKFLDATIPAGTSQLTYQIQAVRSTGIGNWAQYNVTFGNPGIAGAQTVTVTQAEALPRMAA